MSDPAANRGAGVPPARSRALLVSGALALGSAFVPGAARADADVSLSLGTNLAYVRTLPAFASDSVETPARTIHAGRVPTGGSLLALGVTMDLGLSLDAHWRLPLLGAGGYGAVGAYDAIGTSFDGSIARVRPWTTYGVDLLLPGVGYRVTYRRFSAGAAVRTGFIALHVDGSVATGATSTPLDLTASSVVLAAELEACRRLDPITRACLVVSPRIYEFGFMNGATAGLRVEWGR